MTALYIFYIFISGNHSVVRFNNTSLLDNSSSHISTTYTSTTTNHSINHPQVLSTPRRNTLSSFLDFFRSKRSKCSNTTSLSNGYHSNRTQIRNTSATNSIETCEAHLHMIPLPLCNRTVGCPDKGQCQMSGTQSIEKLYVSRKDNPVYSMLPQQDPCEVVRNNQSPHFVRNNQSPHKHLTMTIGSRSDEADWIRENIPPEHNMLIRSPPPIKRLDSPLHMSTTRTSPLRTRFSETDVTNRNVDDSSRHITRFITTADVCRVQQDCINGNRNNTYT